MEGSFDTAHGDELAEYSEEISRTICLLNDGFLKWLALNLSVCPCPYEKESILFVQYCNVKLAQQEGGEITCSFRTYFNWFIGNRRKWKGLAGEEYLSGNRDDLPVGS
jgi:hypothetical protein